CVLIPTRTGLASLEREIERLGIPYRLESASLVFETQEIRDLLNFLRAVDDPSDHVATVAALRSPAFGCSDVDLLRHHEACGGFDYLSVPAPGGTGIVNEGMDVLREFHHRRVWEPASAVVDRFIRKRGLMEAAVGHPRMREQWRRYRFMVEQARQFAEVGGGSLRAFVDWVEDQIQEGARVTEAPLLETDEDAVRVMTVHGSKGLEFPVVILTGLNSNPGGRSPGVLIDRETGSVEVGIGSGADHLGTAGYEVMAEREKLMAAAEHVRLMYVGATRARDHLVVSLRRQSGPRAGNSAAAVISGHMAESPELWEHVKLCPRAETALAYPNREPEGTAVQGEHSSAA
ncbi:MAG: DNA helicase UvrD, partial [Dehalococcoidia bacterium]|nr:DNA helicase UvrD [Dehalococcoidia bacterium]